MSIFKRLAAGLTAACALGALAAPANAANDWNAQAPDETAIASSGEAWDSAKVAAEGGLEAEGGSGGGAIAPSGADAGALGATAEVSELGVPIHSRTVTDNGDGTFKLTYNVDGKSNPSVVHLGGDVIVAYDTSGSMGELAAKVKAATSALASKSLDGVNATLPDAQQNRVAYTSMSADYEVQQPMADKSGNVWFNNSKTFDDMVNQYNATCVDCDGLTTTVRKMGEMAIKGRQTSGSKDAFIVTDGGTTDGVPSPEAIQADFGGAARAKDWTFHLIHTGGESRNMLPQLDANLKKAGLKSELISEEQMQKVFEQLGADQATSWRVAEVSVTDDFGPYVDPVDAAKAVVACTDRADVEPGEDATGCDKSPKPDEVKTTWDPASRKLTIAWPDKGELGAKARYTVSLDVKVNDAGKKHYEDSGYKYDGVKGAEGTGDTAGAEGYPVSKDDKSSVLNYTFHRNGTPQGGAKTSPFALPVVLVGRLESTLVYDANGGEGSMPAVTAEHGTNVTVAENGFDYPGHRFMGWATTKDGRSSTIKPGEPIRLAAKSQTLYAQWTEKPATLSYNKNSEAAVGSMDVQQGLDGEKVKVQPNGFTWAGRTFTGWNTAKDGSGDKYAAGDEWTLKEGDAVLYAQWKANPSTIAYLPGSDQATGETAPNSGLVDETVKVSVNGFVRTGYTFVGWRVAPESATGDDPSKTESDAKDGLTDDEADAGSKKDDAAATPSADATDKPDKDATDSERYDPTVARSGDGAATAKASASPEATADKTDGSAGDAAGDKTDATDKSDADKTPSDGKTDGSDAAGDKTDKTDGSAGDAAGGKTDATDKSDADGKGKPGETDPDKLIQPGDERKLVIEGETLEAVWRPNVYRIRFDGNGEGVAGTMADQTMTYDQPANLERNAFSRAGWTWEGWNTDAKGAGDAYTDGQQVLNLTADDGEVITVHAQWKPIPLPQTGLAVGGIALTVGGLIAAGSAMSGHGRAKAPAKANRGNGRGGEPPVRKVGYRE